jgi:peptidoglycan/xylan/chitin deacetylase (PgdA/CDA1 family)
MKSLVKSALCGVYKYSGAMAAQERFAYWSGKRFMSVVLFHRVTDEIPPDGLTVSTAWFAGFCRLMRDRFNVVSVAHLHRLLMAGEMPPRRTVAITFDDCYRDNLAAARLLARFKLPATFFIPTKYVGTDHVFPWDVDLKRMPNLTWKEVTEIQQLGHEIGSHTVSHPDLGRLPERKARRELVDSKKMLEDKLQRPVRWFAYPYGGRSNFRPEYLPLTQELGYKACFSAMSGFIRPNMRGILPREAMPYFRSLTNLELHLSGCLEWFYSAKRGVGLL